MSAQPATPPPAPHAWVQTDHLGHGRLTGTSRTVSCVSASDCWALDVGTLLHTTDGGSTWVDRFVLIPSGIAQVYDLSCVRTGECLATGSRSNGGRVLLVFSSGPTIVREIPLNGLGLDCSTASVCVVVAATGVAASTSDGGATWTTADIPENIEEISCAPGALLCVAVGGVDDSRIGGSTYGMAAVSRDGGRTWVDRSAELPYSTMIPYDIDCVAVTACWLAAGGDAPAAVALTGDGGSTWSLAALPAGFDDVDSVSCTSAVACRVVGFRAGAAADGSRLIGATTQDGVTWTSDALPGPSYVPPFDPRDGSPAVGCAGMLRCVVVATLAGYRPTGTTHRWVAVPLPLNALRVTAVSCGGDTGCVAVGVAVGGAPIALLGTPGAFAIVRMPPAVGLPESIDCAGPRRCVVQSAYDFRYDGFRQQDLLWTTADGGRTWAQGSRPGDDSGYEQAVSCGTPSACLAVVADGGFQSQGDVLSTRDGGVTWQAANLPGTASSPTHVVPSVSCASASSCVLLTGFGSTTTAARTTNLGGRWQSVQLLPGGSPGVSSLACWATTCLATGGSVVRSTDSGTTWSPLPLPQGVTALQSLACTSAGRCVAVAAGGDDVGMPLVSTNAGSRWRHDTAPLDATPITDCYADTCLFLANVSDGVTVVADLS